MNHQRAPAGREQRLLATETSFLALAVSCPARQRLLEQAAQDTRQLAQRVWAREDASPCAAAGEAEVRAPARKFIPRIPAFIPRIPAAVGDSSRRGRGREGSQRAPRHRGGDGWRRGRSAGGWEAEGPQAGAKTPVG